MKNIIITFLLIITFQYTNAQKFIKTNKYTIVNKKGTKQQEYTMLFDVVTTDSTAKKVGTIQVSDVDSLDDVRIRILSSPNLEEVKEVIRIDTDYSGCCAYTNTFYFLATDKNDFISLPNIENTYCEETISQIKYLFPAQKFGKENMILKAKITYSENIETIKKRQIIQSLVWKDDTFNTNESITSVDIDKSY